MTPREEDVLDVLTRKVRLLAIGQLAFMFRGRTPSPSAARDARRWASRLVDRGLARMACVLARPALPLRSPVIVWGPGERTPDFGKAAYAVQSRWKKPVLRIPCLVASERANGLLGTSARPLGHPLQVTHDLGLSQVYVRLRSVAPDAAAYWVGEDALAVKATRGARLPDAALCSDEGRITLAIEFGGAYPPARLRSFHEACERSGLPYQLW